MRWTIAVVFAGCASIAHAPQVDHRVHSVTCGGVRVAVPSSLRVVQQTSHELIAASPEVALAVFEDGPSKIGGSARVIEQISDLDRPMYRVAFRDADRCTFRAVALLPASDDGLAVMTEIAGTPQPSMIVGSPRVRSEPALTVLLRMVEDHL